MSKSEKQKMLAGELYRAADPEIQVDLEATKRWLDAYNNLSIRSVHERHKLLVQRLASVGEGSVIRPPFYCDYGFNIHIGKDVFLNFNCIILDVVQVVIGDGAQIGPAVQIYTADHPRDASLRRNRLELGQAISIGRNAWIGGGAIILPGVTIGEDAIVGAGAIVTHDVADGTTVAGNPARPLSR